MMRLVGCCLGLLLAFTARPTVAQVPESATASLGTFTEVDVLLTGGVTTFFDTPEPVGGLVGRVRGGRIGGIALGHYGWTEKYSSMLLGIAPSAHLFDLGSWGVSAFVGYGYYSERSKEIDAGRGAHGGVIGGLATLRTDAVVFSIIATDLIGRYAGGDVPDPFSFHVPRLSVGIGI